MRVIDILSGLLCLALSVGPALAQATTAITSDVAPIYLKPDATRTPLRTAARGTRLIVIATEGEWINVEFNDPQMGARVGWVSRSLVAISDPTTTPMDLSVPTPVTPVLQRAGEAQAATLGQAPMPVRIVDEDTGRAKRITGLVFTLVGLGVVALEAAYGCHYGSFEDCSDPDKVLLIGGTAMFGSGVLLSVTAPRPPKRMAGPVAQLRYSVRF